MQKSGCSLCLKYRANTNRFLSLENEMWRKNPITCFRLSRVCYLYQRLIESEEKYRLCTCSFRDPLTLKHLNVTQFKTKGACFALQFFYPAVQSKVLVMKTIITQAVYYLPQRLDTPLFPITINPLLHSTSVIGFLVAFGSFCVFQFCWFFYWKSLFDS